MKRLVSKPVTRMLAMTVGAATIAATSIPAMAQDEVSEARLRKIEAEIRALQRNVFPGGEGRFFEPQITPDGNTQTTANNSGASTTAVTDILARLDAIELQLQRLTAISEENLNSLSEVETRLTALESSPGEPQLADSAEAVEEAEEAATDTNLAAMTGGASSSAATRQIETNAGEQAPAGPSAERLAAVQAITKPQSGDEADDEYSYGYRLWNAGFYPEARQQLSDFVEKYPSHWRATFGRNLLGRAFLDDGMPDDAARWFLRNYQADRTAARAPDSLLYLAESMIALNDTRRACIALAEFGETYPAVASGRLLNKYEENRGKVTCE